MANYGNCNCSELLSGGITRGCESNSGGIQKVYIADYCAVESVTSADGTISAITMVTASPANLFYEFAFNRNTSEFTENAVVNVENGSLFYDQTGTLVIPRREVAKRNALAMLMSKDLLVIIQDQNGLYWLFGETNGVYVSELPSTSGKAKADGSSYTITFKGEEPAQAQEVDPSAVAAVI